MTSAAGTASDTPGSDTPGSDTPAIGVIRMHVEVGGIVQGVGFRPYIYRLATERKLTGFTLNTAAGVTIEVQGNAPEVQDFVQRLVPEAPPLSKITEFITCVVPSIAEEDGFHILKSKTGEQPKVLISPDMSVCEDCRREMFDPADRRYGYPFINCTNCGPRFTIVRDIPYDRPLTSMSVFPMCPQCQSEYEDPLNRRFHAQPNACWICGPQVELWDPLGNKVEVEDPIEAAAAEIRAGKIVAVKGLGGFHLAVDALNAGAVERLRERKHRVEKPFAIMVPDAAAVEQVCECSEAERKALLSPQRPIVLLRRKSGTAIGSGVAPGNRDLGVFLPYTPLHHLLFAVGGFKALVMTSANLSEEPIVIDNQEATRRLGEIADCLLVHNREILIRSDDSVVRLTGTRMRQMRRSRGFVPMPIFLKDEVPTILAVGGELKNTICLTRDKTAFLSQHIGDLENLESYNFFGETVRHMERILEVAPKVVAYDLHPNYFSTQWAKQQPEATLIGVQHHHAHIASCMAENHLEGKVIGLALDGTGYGTDGQIWGGEVLVAGYEDFERAAHLQYIPMASGQAAIHEPWRMALSYLWQHFGDECLNLDIPFVQGLDRQKSKILIRTLENKFNAPLTSSTGRLFDAVSALVGLRSSVNYEGQAAIELEMAIDPDGGDTTYPVHIEEGAPAIINTKPMFAGIVKDLERKIPVGVISRRFHNGLAAALAQVARTVRDRTQLDRVCLSGGSFQNAYLAEALMGALQTDGFQVFIQSEVPSGDGGLSLGQAMVAAARLKSGNPLSK